MKILVEILLFYSYSKLNFENYLIITQFSDYHTYIYAYIKKFKYETPDDFSGNF